MNDDNIIVKYAMDKNAALPALAAIGTAATKILPKAMPFIKKFGPKTLNWGSTALFATSLLGGGSPKGPKFKNMKMPKAPKFNMKRPIHI